MNNMKQIDLTIEDALQERRWFPEDHKDGDSFAVRTYNGVWKCATLINGAWLDEHSREIMKAGVSHWARLEL